MCFSYFLHILNYFIVSYFICFICYLQPLINCSTLNLYCFFMSTFTSYISCVSTFNLFNFLYFFLFCFTCYITYFVLPFFGLSFVFTLFVFPVFISSSLPVKRWGRTRADTIKQIKQFRVGERVQFLQTPGHLLMLLKRKSKNSSIA
jgi:hypothetical protein